MDSEKRKRVFTCITLFLLNFILKFIYVAVTDIGLDEPFTIFNAQRDLIGIIELLKSDNNPPLHLIFMHFWIKMFGTGLISVRFPSVLFSSLAAIALFLTTTRHFNYRTGLFAALLFTASTTNMFYAHDSRVYSLFILLSILNLNEFLNLMYATGINSKRTFLKLTIINIVLCYSHFFGFVILFIETIVCILIGRLRKNLIKLSASVVIVIFTFIWYIPIIADRFRVTTSGNWIPDPVISDLYTMIWRFSNVPVLAVLFIMISLVILFMKWNFLNKLSNDKSKILVLLFLTSYFFLFFVSFTTPVFIDRYLLFTSAYFYIIISITILNILNNPNWDFLIAASLTVAMFYTLEVKKGKKERTKELAEFVRLNSAGNTNIIITPKWFDLNLIYHLKPDWFKNFSGFEDSLKHNNFFAVNKAENIPILNRNTPVILIDNSGENNSVISFMESNYKTNSEKEFGGNLKAILFVPKP